MDRNFSGNRLQFHLKLRRYCIPDRGNKLWTVQDTFCEAWLVQGWGTLELFVVQDSRCGFEAIKSCQVVQQLVPFPWGNAFFGLDSSRDFGLLEMRRAVWPRSMFHGHTVHTVPGVYNNRKLLYVFWDS